MKTFLTIVSIFFLLFLSVSNAQMIITGGIDGPLTGGIPKAIEFYVYEDIPDLSTWGFGSANNGGGSDGEEFTFPADAATAGTFLYVATEATAFNAFFGFDPDYVDGTAPNINGDDAIELFHNGSVVDIYGEIDVDGSGQPWDYLDGWFYRIDDTGPDGTTFAVGNWNYSGINALDGETSNATAAIPFPIGTYMRTGPAPSAVINEFVFNHTGTDDHEFIEVFGAASTDLSSLSILVVEGTGGVITNVFPVGTTDANGFWTTALLTNELGNETQSVFLVHNFTGALSDDLDTDNDGVFDVTPWNSILDDIGVEGTAGTLNYASVTLTPGFDGGIYTVGGASRIPNGTDTDTPADWVRNDFDGEGFIGFAGTLVDGEAINTPGFTNMAWEPPPPPIADFIINEVDADQTGTDTDEFIEIFDGGVGNLALDGLVVVLFNGATDVSYAAYDLDGYITDENGYFVLGCSTVPNVDLVFPAADNNVQNGADAVAIYQGNDFDFPTGTPVTTDFLVDAFVYGTDDPDDAELLVLLNAGQLQVNENGAGNKDIHSSQRYPNGSGGARNTDTYLQFEPTPGEFNFPPAPSIVINEVDADQTGTDSAEFLELFAQSPVKGAVSLNGLVVVLYNGSNDLAYDVIGLDGYSTDENGYFVIGSAEVPNVDLIAFTTNGIQNGADAIALYHGPVGDYTIGMPVTTDNLIDAIVYGTSDADDPELLVLLNPDQPQVDENGNGSGTKHSSQRYPNGSGGTRNTDTYAQFYPTPGGANVFPIATVDVEFLSESLNPEQISTQTFTLTNTGEGTLFFNVDIVDNTKGSERSNEINTPLDFWLSVSPMDGTVAPGTKGTQELEVTFNSTGLSLGVYQAVIHILSNDAANDDIQIPVTLNVGAFLEGSFVYVNDKTVIGLEVTFTNEAKNTITVVTDNDGKISVPVMLPGQYTVTLSGGLETDPYVISTIDALYAHKMAQKIIPVPDIRSLEFKAADVSADGWISDVDPTFIFDYIFGLIDQFPRGQWFTENEINPLIITDEPFIDLGVNKTILCGDVDLSYRMDAVPGSTISLFVNDSKPQPIQDKITVPVFADNDIYLSALVTNIEFDSESFEVESIQSKLPNLRYQVKDNLIMITSLSKKSSVKIEKGDELLNITLNKKSDDKIDYFAISIPTNAGTALNKEGNESELKLSTITFGEILPNQYELSQNYPNPFNPSTTIKFGLPEAGKVRLEVFNILGESVAVLVNGFMDAGYHFVEFSNSSLSSGAYIYRINVDGKFNAVKKMILLR